MIALVVKKDTEVKTIQEGLDWTWENIKSEALSEDKLFFLEDVQVDPLGKVGCGPQQKVVGGSWAKAGWYGFKDIGRTLLVPFNEVVTE